MRRVVTTVLSLLCAVYLGASSSSYLFVWAGDAEHKASDFLAVIDASPTSAGYGTVVASIPTGVAGTHPHHTEHAMPPDGHLLANGSHAGRTWLFDLSRPLQPRILASFGDVAGYSHPHTFIRLANGHVLATGGGEDDAARWRPRDGAADSRTDDGRSRGNGRTRAPDPQRQCARCGD